MGLLGCNLRSYTLEFNKGSLSTAEDVFNWVLESKKIKKFNFTIDDVVNAAGSEYRNDDGEDCVIDTAKNYSNEEMKDLLLILSANGLLDDGDYYNICNQTEFEDFYITTFYAYIHSGISVSLSDPRDQFDSGLAGFVWVEPYEKQSLEDAKEFLKEEFNRYNEWLNGYYMYYTLQTFEREGEGWVRTDDVCYIEESIDAVWQDAGLADIEDEGDFGEDTYEYIRKQQPLEKDDVVDFLVNYL